MCQRKEVQTRRELADTYDEIHRKHEFHDRPRFYGWIADLAEVQPEQVCLDIACGRGLLLSELEARGAVSVGVDLSEVALLRCRENHSAALVAVADGERLPFASDTFDIAFHLGNLEHFFDPLAGAREMVRVMKPGGRAVVMLPNSYYSGDLWKVIRTGYGPNHHQPIDRFATRREWEDLLEEAGLTVEKTVAYNKFKWWKHLLPFNLAYHFVYLAGK